MSATTLTLDDDEEDSRADKFGEFVFENGVIVRVTERDDFTGNATEKPNVDKEELNVDTTTIHSDYDYGEVSTKKTKDEEETTEEKTANIDVTQTESPISSMTYNGVQGEDSRRVDVNVSSYHNYSALVDLFGSLEGQYGHIVTRCGNC